MKSSRLIRSPLVVFSVVAAMVLLPVLIGRATKSSEQDSEKSLDIQRHANEPLELVDLKVSEHSVKSKVKGKYRNGDEGREGLDKVEFQDKHDWFKRVRVKLRNVSGKTIIGLQAYLYLKPPESQVRFSVSLTGPKQLEHTTLEPGDEIEIFVDDGSWSRMVNRIRQSGADENEAAVTLSVENVMFSGGLLWNRGQFFRQDPLNPNRWNRVDPKSPPGISRLNDPAQFRTAAFRPDQGGRRRSWGKSVDFTLTPQPLQANAKCEVDSGFIADYCSSYGCYTITRFGNGAGLQSTVPVSGDCRQYPDGVDRGFVCTDQTTHYIF